MALQLNKTVDNNEWPLLNGINKKINNLPAPLNDMNEEKKNTGNEPLPKKSAIEESDEKLRRQFSGARSIVDYVMGVFFIVGGIIFLFRKQFAIAIEKYPPDALDIVAGILFIAYGSWRIYRGYKKNYFRA